MRELRIFHLYPDVLNLYGDRGNVLCLKRRLEWRGLGCSMTEVPMGERARLSEADICFIGGGQDFEQGLLMEDLRGGRAQEIKSAVEDGVTFLCVCGGYQLMGHYYETAAGERCPFIGALDLATVGDAERMIGNFAFETAFGTVVGFENHSGRTRLGGGVEPLGRVLRGSGNNGEDGTEGARYRNVFCTYSHGPVLPKNPAFADALLASALERRCGDASLAPLGDLAEREAHESVLKKVLG